MNEIDVNSLVVVDSLPHIIEQLDTLGKYIDEGLKDIDKLECTEENKQLVKNKRAEINNTLKILEDKRKDIKKKILEPYEAFNSKFEDVAKLKLQNASEMLGNKINEIEIAQKQEKETALREFTERQFKANDIQDIVKFEDIGLNITLSASEKSLKEQVVTFVERIRNDLDTILLEDLRDEILLEYKKCLSYTQAKQTVLTRHKELEQTKAQTDELSIKAQNDSKIQAAVVEVVKEDEIIVPNEVEVNATTLSDMDEVIIVTFTIKETRKKLKLLKQFMADNEIDYE